MLEYTIDPRSGDTQIPDSGPRIYSKHGGKGYQTLVPGYTLNIEVKDTRL